MNKLREPSLREQELASLIRSAVVNYVEKRGIGVEELSDLLGLLPSGVEVLLRESEWPLEVAVRVASALQMDVEVKAHVG